LKKPKPDKQLQTVDRSAGTAASLAGPARAPQGCLNRMDRVQGRSGRFFTHFGRFKPPAAALNTAMHLPPQHHHKNPASAVLVTRKIAPARRARHRTG